MDPGRSLTRREFETVIRRATELALGESDSHELTEADLFRIAREVGVPDRHVRLALAEVRSGEVGGGALDRIFGPELVLAARVIPGERREIADTIDRFLVAGRLLQAVRRGAGILQYRPAVDWMSQVARVASATSRRYYVASAKSVEVRLEAVEEGRTLVEFRVEPGTRGEAVAGAFLGGGLGGLGGAIGVGIAIGTVAPVGLAVLAGAAVAGGVSGGVTWGVARSHRRKLRDIRSEVEGILDQLEMGEPLEPPPPSWREWVRRQFHGSAKILIDPDAEEPPRRQ